jgi:DNA modification methylase
MDIDIIVGDVRDVLKTLPDNSIDCCVTSPPYWGLRDYGVDGQIGLEPTMQEYLETMVGVFHEVRRVLKPEGTFWLNIGDCYFKKSLAMIPNRLAIALQEDGWYVRSEIIWHKPNPIPESIKNRPTSSHEKIWLMTKGDKYFYDADSIKEAATSAGKVITLGEKSMSRGQSKGAGVKPSGNGLADTYTVPEKRNARNVWSITTKPFKGAHFATMPPELAERCIKAGCPEGGIVLDPFGGAGTTGMVAIRLNRNATLIELNNEYANIARDRIFAEKNLFTI